MISPSEAQDDPVSLVGIIDFHTHSGPDSRPRSITDLEVTRLFKEAGLRGMVLKNHFTMTADRAALAARRNALADIRTAVDAGEPFAEPLAVLQDPPAPLVENAENGVPTLATLQASFPDAARRAIASARNANPDEGGRFGNFLRNQFGTRSITPRDGDDPDAVLSRAEAALTSGKLDEAVTQVEFLPDPALSDMSDWLAQARTRLSVVTALQQVDTDASATPAAN